jgi:hypothetical protein
VLDAPAPNADQYDEPKPRHTRSGAAAVVGATVVGATRDGDGPVRMKGVGRRREAEAEATAPVRAAEVGRLQAELAEARAEVAALAGREAERAAEVAAAEEARAAAEEAAVLAEAELAEAEAAEVGLAEAEAAELEAAGVEWLVVCCPEGVAPGEALVVETASGQSVEVLVPEVSTALSD